MIPRAFAAFVECWLGLARVSIATTTDKLTAWGMRPKVMEEPCLLKPISPSAGENFRVLLRLFVGMVARAHQRAALDHAESN